MNMKTKDRELLPVCLSVVRHAQARGAYKEGISKRKKKTTKGLLILIDSGFVVIVSVVCLVAFSSPFPSGSVISRQFPLLLVILCSCCILVCM